MIDRDAFVLSTLSSDDPFDTEKLFKAHQLIKEVGQKLRERYDLELRNVNLGGYAYNECKKLIMKEGISEILSKIRFQEEVLSKTSDIRHQHLIVEVLRNKIIDLSPTKSLIIVDNYIFPKSIHTESDTKDYLQMFVDIFEPTIIKVEQIDFVTKSNYNHNLFADLEQLLLKLNSQLSIACKTTDEFHDRFWIVDQNKGLFIGTSLNGIGKRYSLVDVIRDEDTQELIKVLKKMNII